MNNQTQIVDKGRIVVVVDQFPEKVNGQVVIVPGTNRPKMKNKWMTVGEATKFGHPDGSVSEQRKIYLQPVAVLNPFYEEKTFWDSEQQQSGYQNQAQQQAPQQGGYQQQAQQQQQANYNQRRG